MLLLVGRRLLELVEQPVHLRLRRGGRRVVALRRDGALIRLLVVLAAAAVASRVGLFAAGVAVLVLVVPRVVARVATGVLIVLAAVPGVAPVFLAAVSRVGIAAVVAGIVLTSVGLLGLLRLVGEDEEPDADEPEEPEEILEFEGSGAAGEVLGAKWSRWICPDLLRASIVHFRPLPLSK